MFANHGRTKKYDHDFEGVNSRLDGLQAAILSVKLRHLDEWTESRRQNAYRYNAALKGTGVVTPVELDDVGPSITSTSSACRTDGARRCRSFLKAAGIDTGIHYPIALPYLNAYRHLGHSEADFPDALKASREILSLPMFPELTAEQVGLRRQQDPSVRVVTTCRARPRSFGAARTGVAATGRAERCRARVAGGDGSVAKGRRDLQPAHAFEWSGRLAMNYVLITRPKGAGHTEQAVVAAETIESVIAQTCIGVARRWPSAGSSSTTARPDRTADIVAEYAARPSWIELVRRHPRVERSFAGKVQSVNAGLERCRDSSSR